MPTKHYIEFFYPGTFFVSTDVFEMSHRDPSQIIMKGSAYAFRFFDIEEVTFNDETLRGVRKNPSKVYYPGGKIRSYEEIAALGLKSEEMLLSNMKCNNWSHVIYTYYNGWPQPYDSERQEVIELKLEGEISCPS